MKITVITDDKTGKIVGTARADSGSSTPGSGAGSLVAGPGQSVRELQRANIRDIKTVAALHTNLQKHLGQYHRLENSSPLPREQTSSPPFFAAYQGVSRLLVLRRYPRGRAGRCP